MALHVERNVPHGNVCATSVAKREGIPEVRFTADPHGGPESLWFRFALIGDAPTGARLVLEHGDTMLGAGDPARLQPVVRCAGEAWRRLEPGEPQIRPDGRVGAVWPVGAFSGGLDVAFCYPYGRSDLDALVADTAPYWHEDAIGVSQAGRALPRLANDYGAGGGERSGIYVVARQHCGETPGSWVLDGMLRRFSGRRDAAPLVWAVPFADLDGVENGDYGKDAFPYDVNRAWGTPPMRHETLVMRRDIVRWKGRCSARMVLDLHAPGAGERDGIYAYLTPPGGTSAPGEAVAAWAETIGRALGPEYAAEEFARHATYPSRWNTPSLGRWVGEELGVASLGIETPYAATRGGVLTEERYRDAGARIADGVMEHIAATS